MQLVTCDDGRRVLSMSAWVDRLAGVRCGAAKVVGGARRSDGTPRVVGKLQSCSEVGCAAPVVNVDFGLIADCAGSLQLGGSLGCCEAISRVVGMQGRR